MFLCYRLVPQGKCSENRTKRVTFEARPWPGIRAPEPVPAPIPVLVQGAGGQAVRGSFRGQKVSICLKR